MKEVIAMKKIASFTVDHRYIDVGVYISRVDGDVTTYDLRTRKPNTGRLMDNATMHSIEHLFATFVRNSDIGGDVIYFGPMGCQTGFYLLVRNADNGEVLSVIKECLREIINYTGKMPGASELECGNYRNLNVALAQNEARDYYDRIKNLTEDDLRYPESERHTIGIIGAMDAEMDGLKAAMSGVTSETVAGVEFLSGTISGRPVIAAVSGVGKVNAAVCAQTMILEYNPSVISSTGVAGGHKSLRCGDVVVASSVVQHDMDTSPLGDEAGFISGINLINIPCSKKVSEGLIRAAGSVGGIECKYGVIATGDRFICSSDDAEAISKRFGALAYEMESGSIGQVCFINGVEFAALRAISDNGDDGANESYAEFMSMAAEKNIKILKKYLAFCG